MQPEIRLTWQDPSTGEQQELLSSAPVAIGRNLNRMPTEYEQQPISHVVLPGSKVSGFHALIVFEQRWIICDRSKNGVLVNNKRVDSSLPLRHGDLLQIDTHRITFTQTQSTGTEATQTSFIESEATTTIYFESEATERFISEISPQSSFLQQFEQSDFVSISEVYAARMRVDETEYVALGGGMGSFAFVDTLRICGVDQEKIWVIGPDPKPYSRYQSLCLNSQIRPHNRLRSGSDSCPDNIWGWPGYALREAFRDFFKGKVSAAVEHLWKVFAEPILADTYTPKSQDVFNSIDREAQRIGWSLMWRYGRIRCIRKTLDGRYAIVYSCTDREKQEHRLLITRYVHLSTGYSAIRFLTNLQAYREQTGDLQSVVNAYENHEHVYKHLEKHGGTVMIRGGGIVASRVIQRVYELRQLNPQITVVHLLRTRKATGNKVGLAKRGVANSWEFQPYNWPKATWGGVMRDRLEQASPRERSRLLSKDVWGGTTTASRQDWQKIIAEGTQDKWYLLRFGEVKDVVANPHSQDDRGKLMIQYVDKNTNDYQSQIADFVIDATGLEARPQFQPFLKDVIERYGLSTNPLGRLDVTNEFRVKGMENGAGKMYASGVITLGGPYAPVDTFLGLQYTARRAVDDLEKNESGVRYLKGFNSLEQWCKWVLNYAP